MPVSSSQNGFTILSEILQAYQLAVNEAAIVSITDPGGKILYVNDKFMEISKYSAEELIGKTHRVINSGYHPDSFFREM
ncbi:MAG: PAS domain S-box protein, partial [Chitinophagaceae bacterium]